MQRIKPEVSEIIEFEDQDKSKIIASFETLEPSGFCCKEEMWHLFKLNVGSKTIFVEWDLDWRNQASTTGETLIFKIDVIQN